MHTTRTNQPTPNASGFQWPGPREIALIAASTALPYLLAAILVAL